MGEVLKGDHFMGFLDWIFVFIYSLVLFWPITLGFGAVGLVLGWLSVKFVVPRTGTVPAVLLGAVFSYFVPTLIGHVVYAYAAPAGATVADESLNALVFTWAGGGGTFIGYCLALCCILVARRIRSID